MDTSKIEQNPVVKAIGLQALHLHQAIYERTDGRLGHKLLGTPCLLLRTTGAKTGAARTNGLVYAKDGADYLIVASFGGAPKAPGWYQQPAGQRRGGDPGRHREAPGDGPPGGARRRLTTSGSGIIVNSTTRTATAATSVPPPGRSRWWC